MSVQALTAGFLLLLRHPMAWLLAYSASVVIALPLAAAMTVTLAETAAGSHPAPLERGAVYADWWTRLNQGDAPLAREFVPRTLGFAAALDGLSTIVDGPRAHALVIIVAIVLYGAMWALLWSVILTRFVRLRPAGFRHAWRASRQFAWPMLSISAVAALAVAVLYAAVRPAVVDAMFAWLAAETPRAAFLTRAALSGSFGLAVVAVGAIADLSRAHAVVTGERSAARNIAAAFGFARRAGVSVAIVCFVMLVLHAMLFAGYGAGEVLGGARVGGWRAVAAAQLYVAGRILLRLFWAGSLLTLSHDEFRTASH